MYIIAYIIFLSMVSKGYLLMKYTQDTSHIVYVNIIDNLHVTIVFLNSQVQGTT